jgi:hypothetical protein
MQIEQRKVIGVVKECNAALASKDFNQAEVIIGLAELMGRIIVETGATHIQMDELVNVATKHLKNTITIGSFSRGKSNIVQG